MATITSEAPDLTDVPLGDLTDVPATEVAYAAPRDDPWLRRAVDRIRDEASSVSADAAVAAFNSNI